MSPELLTSAIWCQAESAIFDVPAICEEPLIYIFVILESVLNIVNHHATLYF